MNLYLIYQVDKGDNWDSYGSAVVCAPNEETARNLSPHNGKPINWKVFNYSWWVDSPDKVMVKLLGKANKGVEAGLICHNFRT